MLINYHGLDGGGSCAHRLIIIFKNIIGHVHERELCESFVVPIIISTINYDNYFPLKLLSNSNRKNWNVELWVGGNAGLFNANMLREILLLISGNDVDTTIKIVIGVLPGISEDVFYARDYFGTHSTVYRPDHTTCCRYGDRKSEAS